MRVLITGKGSYIGTHIKKYLEIADKVVVDELDMLDSKWSEYDFHPYDTVIHVAAIVHRKNENITWKEYHNVNTKMAVKVASRAKSSGVKQFIFISTMAVYGQGKELPGKELPGKKLSQGNVIDNNTIPNPRDFYGKSKYEAEIRLNTMNSEEFIVSIVRPPNIFGAGCPGNYINSFTKIVKLLPIFPRVYEDCLQSFLYIDNLCEFIRLLINRRDKGVFCPQDSIGISTYELVFQIAKAINKKMYFSVILGKIIKLFAVLPLIRKIYGGVSYDKILSVYQIADYTLVNFEEAIRNTVAGGSRE